MKGSEQLFSSARGSGAGTDDWGTPQAFYDLLHGEFDFQLDPCASEKFAKCDSYIPPEVDGLKVSWEGLKAFVNFPYSEADAWVDKCIAEADAGSLVVVLCAARTDAKWWHKLAARSSEIRFVKGRLSFVQQSAAGGLPRGMSATFPSCVCVLHPAYLFNAAEGPLPVLGLWDVPANVRRGGMQ